MVDNKNKIMLEALCRSFRQQVIDSLYKAQSGHPGSSLSVCEILTVLYFNVMNIDPKKPDWEERDRLILSKGHAAPMLYVVMAEKGYFPKKELDSLRKINSMLQGHPSLKKTSGVDYTAGPLGLGLSFGAGLATGAKVKGENFHTYTILGDGELQEGGVWEAVMSAVKFKLDNLTIIVDNNGIQLDGTNDHVMPLGNIGEKFSAFGCNVINVDGHDVEALITAFEQAKAVKNRPTAIIAKTIKGKGVSFMENKSYWHSALITENIYHQAMKELGVAAG